MNINYELVGKKRITLVLVILFVIFRVVFIDRDLSANPDLAIYGPTDEGFYTIHAFNLFHYGEFVHQIVPFIGNEASPVNLFQNIITAFTLMLFGNNYYGLRTASTLAALIVFLLTIAIIRKVSIQNSQESEGVTFFWLVFLLCDYSFILAGRMAEPTIFRMTFMMIMIYLCSLYDFDHNNINLRQSFFLGFLAVVSVLYVYLHNIFILFAFASLITFASWKSGWKKTLSCLTLYLTGFLVGLCSYEVILEKVFNTNISDLYATILNSFGDRANFTLSLKDYLAYLLNSFFKNASIIFSTNVFRFNVTFLFLFLLSLPIYLHKIIKQKRNFDLLIMSLVFFLVAQTIILNDFIYKKMIMILPLAVIMITGSYNYIDTFLIELNNKNNLKILYRGCFAISILFTMYIFKSTFAMDSFKTEYVLNGLNLIGFILTIGLIVFRIRLKLDRQNLIFMFILIMLVPNLFLDMKYIYLNPTFYYRDMMIALSPKINGKVVAGGHAYSMRLYNTSIPVLNPYIYQYQEDTMAEFNKKFDRLFQEKIASYSITYNGPSPRASEPFTEQYMYEHGLVAKEVFDPKIPRKYKMAIYGDKGMPIVMQRGELFGDFENKAK